MAKDDEAQKPARGRGKVIIALVALNLVSIGGVGYFALMGNQATAASPNEAQGEASGDEAADEGSGFGKLVEVPSLVANLHDPDAGRYVKVQVFVEVEDDAKAQKLQELVVPVRNELLLYFSSVKVDDTVGEPNKTRIADELRKRLDKVVGEGLVKRLFFSEFVVQ